MDGDKIKKKLFTYARDFALEKINKTLDKKLAASNQNESQQSASEAESAPGRLNGGKVAASQRSSVASSRPRSSRYQEPKPKPREDEFVNRRRHRIRLTRDQRDRFSLARSDEDSCVDGDDRDEDDRTTDRTDSRKTSKRRSDAEAAAFMRRSNSGRTSQQPPQRFRGDRASGGMSASSSTGGRNHVAPLLVTSQGERLYLYSLFVSKPSGRSEQQAIRRERNSGIGLECFARTR